jgi:SAM-dependent methyltransferase
VEHGRRAPEGFEASTPNVARMYDYYLGGKDNFPADRQAAERVLAIVPEVRAAVRANRAFVGRAVRFLAAAGVRQFLDVGSGLPTRRNVHEVAHELAPDARVVYVDDDPVVVVHGRALLACTDTVAVVQGDLRRPEEVLGHPEVRALIDLDEPVAVLLTLVLHFVTDAEDPVGIVRRLRDAKAPGSYLVVSHGTGDPRPGTAPRVAAVYQQASAPIVSRSRAEVLRFFDGFDLVGGLGYVMEWRPDLSATVYAAERSLTLAGVGRKRGRRGSVPVRTSQGVSAR